MSFNDFFDEEKFDFEAERKKFIDNLDFLKSMFHTSKGRHDLGDS
jgi:hypothetical protein